MKADLSSSQLSYLNECRAVAVENCLFYSKAYDASENGDAKILIGSAASQRKVFVEAMSAILNNAEKLPSLNSASNRAPKTFVLNLPDEIGKLSEYDFAAQLYKHEQQFLNAIDHAIEHITDKTSLEVLRHHKRAAEIATQAIFEAQAEDSI